MMKGAGVHLEVTFGGNTVFQVLGWRLLSRDSGLLNLAGLRWVTRQNIATASEQIAGIISEVLSANAPLQKDSKVRDRDPRGQGRERSGQVLLSRRTHEDGGRVSWGLEDFRASFERDPCAPPSQRISAGRVTRRRAGRIRIKIGGRVVEGVALTRVV